MHWWWSRLFTGCDPRPPRGGRPVYGGHAVWPVAVAIHAPLAEGDRCTGGGRGSSPVAIHAPLAEGDAETEVVRKAREVAIHAPLAEGDPGGPPHWA